MRILFPPSFNRFYTVARLYSIEKIKEDFLLPLKMLLKHSNSDTDCVMKNSFSAFAILWNFKKIAKISSVSDF
jgi:hypothetical protein